MSIVFNPPTVDGLHVKRFDNRYYRVFYFGRNIGYFNRFVLEAGNYIGLRMMPVTDWVHLSGWQEKYAVLCELFDPADIYTSIENDKVYVHLTNKESFEKFLENI